MLPEFTNAMLIWSTIQEIGFLPYFRSSIPGFSIEEHTPSNLWFSDENPGPWDWKGPIIQMGDCVYGKFFSGKAGFISSHWFADFANFRRNGYDFDARYDDGLSSIHDMQIWKTVEQHPKILSKTLKQECGYTTKKKSGFDTASTRLQMQTYLVIDDFKYAKDRFGRSYGWGIAEYSLPEQLLGESFQSKVYAHSPEESYRLISEHFQTLFPELNIHQIHSFLK